MLDLSYKYYLLKVVKYILPVLLLFGLFTICYNFIFIYDNNDIQILKQLAYKNRKMIYTVNIKQNNKNIPYIILTNNYDNKCLLLRKYLLNENMVFNLPENRSAYYEDSYIDNYLNTEFYLTFSDILTELIQETNITITSEDSLGRCGTETVDIKRKIFLLSSSEVVGEKKSSVRLNEGKHLKFFTNMESRIALHESLEPDNWWLRTPITWDSISVCVIGFNGGTGEIAINNSDSSTKTNGIRPAFCLPGDTPVFIDEIDGEKAYYIVDE